MQIHVEEVCGCRVPCEGVFLSRAGYKANLAAAGESDGRLEARLAQSSSAFSALSLDNAVAAMPRLQVCLLTHFFSAPVSVAQPADNVLKVACEYCETGCASRNDRL